MSSIAALAVRFWLPEPSHMPLFTLTHSLTGGVVIALLIRSLGKARMVCGATAEMTRRHLCEKDGQS